MTELTNMPVIPDSRSDDLHHLESLEDSQLNLFMAGNQFMVMNELVAAFKAQHPGVQRIYYQTLPPGLQLKQIMAGGALFRGRVIDADADIYSSVNAAAMTQLATAGKIVPNSRRRYLQNRIVLLVPAGNPAGIATVEDLGREQVRVSQPDPANEDIAFHIMEMYRQAGGEALVKRIMEGKRSEGTTIMTAVHHRETPLRLQKRTVDVGPVWATEARYASSQQMAVEVIDPGPDLDQHSSINYYICRLKDSPNSENADAFMRFMVSDHARAIYSKYGFIPV